MLFCQSCHWICMIRAWTTWKMSGGIWIMLIMIQVPSVFVCTSGFFISSTTPRDVFYRDNANVCALRCSMESTIENLIPSAFLGRCYTLGGVVRTHFVCCCSIFYGHVYQRTLDHNYINTNNCHGVSWTHKAYISHTVPLVIFQTLSLGIDLLHWNELSYVQSSLRTLYGPHDSTHQSEIFRTPRSALMRQFDESQACYKSTYIDIGIYR